MAKKHKELLDEVFGTGKRDSDSVSVDERRRRKELLNEILGTGGKATATNDSQDPFARTFTPAQSAGGGIIHTPKFRGKKKLAFLEQSQRMQDEWLKEQGPLTGWEVPKRIEDATAPGDAVDVRKFLAPQPTVSGVLAEPATEETIRSEEVVLPSGTVLRKGDFDFDEFFRQQVVPSIDRVEQEAGKRYEEVLSERYAPKDRSWTESFKAALRTVPNTGEASAVDLIRNAGEARRERGPARIVKDVMEQIDPKQVTDFITDHLKDDREYAAALEEATAKLPAEGSLPVSEEEVERFVSEMSESQRKQYEKQIRAEENRISEAQEKLQQAAAGAWERQSAKFQQALADRLIDEMARRNMPRSELEAFARTVYDASIPGLLTEWAVGNVAGGDKALHAQIMQRALEKYDPSLLTRIGGEAAALLLGAPVFGVGGALGKAGAAGVRKLAERNVLRKLLSRGITGGAEGIAQRTVARSLPARLAQGAVASGTTLGAYDVVSEPLQIMAAGVNPGAKDIVGAGARGFATGMLLPGIGMAAGRAADAATSRLGRYASELGGFAAENAAFVGMGTLYQGLRTGEWGTPEQLAEELGHSVGVLGIMKGIGALKRNRVKHRGFYDKVLAETEFTPEEVEALNRIGVDGRSYKRAIFDLLDARETAAGREVAKRAAEQVDSRYAEVMQSPEVPFSAKAKLMYLVEGRIPSTLPLTTDVRRTENEDGRTTVDLLDPAGNLVQRRTFSSEKAAEAFERESAGLREINTIQYYEALLGRMQALDEAARDYAAERGVPVEAVKKQLRDAAEGRPHDREVVHGVAQRARPEEVGMDIPAMIAEEVGRKYGFGDEGMVRALTLKEAVRTPEQRRAVKEYAARLKQFATQELRPEAATPEMRAERQLMQVADQAIAETKNRDDDVVYTATMKDGSTVNIIKGSNLVYDAQSGEVNAAQSDPTVVVRYEDGTLRQVSVGDIDMIDEAVSAADAQAEAWRAIREQLEAAARNEALADAVDSAGMVQLADGRIGVVEGRNKDGTYSVAVQDGEGRIASEQVALDDIVGPVENEAEAEPAQAGAEEEVIGAADSMPGSPQTEEMSTIEATDREIPRLKDGQPDYNAMPADMLAAELSAAIGHDRAVERLQVARSANAKKADKLEKELAGIADLNRAMAVERSLDMMRQEDARLAGALEQLSQVEAAPAEMEQLPELAVRGGDDTLPRDREVAEEEQRVLREIENNGIFAESETQPEMYGTAESGRDKNEPKSAFGNDGGGLVGNATGAVSESGDRGNIRVFEKGLGTSYDEHSEYSQRDRREAESERLVAVAKENGLRLEDSDVPFHKIATRQNVPITFENFYIATRALFEETERPQREPDYISHKFGQPDEISSEYWYGEDKDGKYVVRGSDHWSGFESELPKTDKYRTPISTCYWYWKGSKPKDFKDFKEFFKWEGKLRYGKVYLYDMRHVHPDYLIRDAPWRIHAERWNVIVDQLRQVIGPENVVTDRAEVRSAYERIVEDASEGRFFRTSEGNVYGFTIGGKIYLDSEQMNAETPIHEYTELWAQIVARKNPKLWSRGAELMKQTKVWEKVNSDPNYRDLSDDLRVSETLSRIVAEEFAREQNKIAFEEKILGKIRSWLREFWSQLKETFAKWTKKELEALSAEEFVKMPMRDFVEGIDLRKYAEDPGSDLRFAREFTERKITTLEALERRREALLADRENIANFDEALAAVDAAIDAYKQSDPVAETFSEPEGDAHLRAVEDAVYDMQRKMNIPTQTDIVRDGKGFIDLLREMGASDADLEGISARHCPEGAQWKDRIILRADGMRSKDFVRVTYLHERAHGITKALFVPRQLYIAAKEMGADYMNKELERIDQSYHVDADNVVSMVEGANEMISRMIGRLQKDGRLEAYLATGTIDPVGEFLDEIGTPRKLKELIIKNLQQIKEDIYGTEKTSGIHRSEIGNFDGGGIARPGEGSVAAHEGAGGPGVGTSIAGNGVEKGYFSGAAGNSRADISQGADEDDIPLHRSRNAAPEERLGSDDRAGLDRNQELDEPTHVPHLRADGGSMRPDERRDREGTQEAGSDRGGIERSTGQVGDRRRVRNDAEIGGPGGSIRRPDERQGRKDRGMGRLFHDGIGTAAEIPERRVERGGSSQESGDSIRIIDDPNFSFEESESDLKLTKQQQMIADLRRSVRESKASARAVAQLVSRYVRSHVGRELTEVMGKREFDALIRQIEAATAKQEVEKPLQRIEEIVTDLRIKQAQSRVDKLLQLKVQGEGTRGVSVAKEVDDRTRRMFEIFRDNLGRNVKEVEEELQGRADADLLYDWEALRLLDTYNEALQYRREAGDIDREQELIRSLNTDLRRKRIAANKRGDTTSFERLKEEIVRNNELLDALDAERRQVKEHLAARLEHVGGMLAEQIGYGREILDEWRQKQKEHDKMILDMAFRDVGDGKKIPVLDRQPGAWEKGRRTLLEKLLAPAYSLNYLLKKISVNAPKGEGGLYEHFMRSLHGYVESRGRFYLGYEDFKRKLEEKAQELFGKSYLEVLKQSHDPIDATVSVINGKEKETYALTIGEALYIYMVNKMEDGKVKLRRMGITDADVAMLADTLPPQFVRFADWMQGEFLPERRKVYNVTHLDVFGVQMAAIENYYPLKIQKSDTYQKVDGAEPDPDTLPSAITGSIIQRKRNTKTVDLHTNALELLLEHGQQMEHWNAFTRIVQDMNMLLSSTAFRRMLDTRNPGLHKKLKIAAQLAADSYRPKTNEVNRAWVALGKLAASSKIAFRVNTALKQVLSFPAFYAYIWDPKFWAALTKNLSPTTWAKNFRWALENIPSFRERWLGRMAGNEKLSQATVPMLDKMLDKMNKYGMVPNAFVDALTCANGAKAVYDYKRGSYLKRGLGEEEAERRARIDAAVAINETQQSSEGMFISQMQADRDFWSVSLSTFQNSNFSYLRKQLEGIDELFRDANRERRNRAAYYKEEGLSEEEAFDRALKDVLEAKKGAVLNILVFIFVMNMLWTLGNNVWKYLFSEDSRDEIPGELAKSALVSTVRNTSIGSGIESFANGYDANPSVLLSDLIGFTRRLTRIVEDENPDAWDQTIAYLTLQTLTANGLGVDLESFVNMYQGIAGMIRDGADVEEVMQVLNAPKSQAKLIAGKPKEGETIEEYKQRMIFLERRIASRVEKERIKKWTRNYEAYEKARLLGMKTERDKTGRVTVPELKQLDADYAAALVQAGLTASGRKRKEYVWGALTTEEQELWRTRALYVRKLDEIEKELERTVVFNEAYGNRLKELIGLKSRFVEELNQK